MAFTKAGKFSYTASGVLMLAIEMELVKRGLLATILMSLPNTNNSLFTASYHPLISVQR